MSPGISVITHARVDIHAGLDRYSLETSSLEDVFVVDHTVGTVDTSYPSAWRTLPKCLGTFVFHLLIVDGALGYAGNTMKTEPA